MDTGEVSADMRQNRCWIPPPPPSIDDGDTVDASVPFCAYPLDSSV